MAKIKLTRIKEPKSVEVFYYKKLKQLANQMKQEVASRLIPLILEKPTTNDANIPEILVILQAIRDRFSNLDWFASNVANDVVNKVDENSRTKFIQGVNSSVGVNMVRVLKQEGLSDIVALQKQKNKVLIKSIPEQFFNDIEIQIQNGFGQGLRPEQIARNINGIKDISSSFGKLENRCKLIARNEISTINSTITKKRYENLGVKKAIWRSSNDERVRDSHANRDGKEYDLAKGCYDSIDGIWIQAGMEINCRCTFTPIFDDEEKE